MLSSCFPSCPISKKSWMKAASRGPWGASLALRPGTKPGLDVADYMDRSAFPCLSAGCCLSRLCTVQEEVHPLVDWVCLSVKQTFGSTETSFFESVHWVEKCGHGRVFACSELHFLLAEFEVMDYLSHGLNQQGKSQWQTPSCSRFSLKLKTLVLYLFLDLLTKHELFILLDSGNIKAYVIVSFHCYQLTQ